MRRQAGWENVRRGGGGEEQGGEGKEGAGETSQADGEINNRHGWMGRLADGGSDGRAGDGQVHKAVGALKVPVDARVGVKRKNRLGLRYMKGQDREGHDSGQLGRVAGQVLHEY